jgi:hypothetical protein
MLLVQLLMIIVFMFYMTVLGNIPKGKQDPPPNHSSYASSLLILKGRCKSVTRVLQGSVARVLQECCEGVTRERHRSVKS